ncbi:MAG: bifunctional 4-hydroxy-3-methylbut-2-enyl diphosphate reductase/30S ribosomal protein S1 [Clostridia bacterium]|nr:bifunctional 4-hydroxy-3-methylbut-2-enyl diphosphate reductase/30S ribosomal protein S1 [Clostridia bacterium]
MKITVASHGGFCFGVRRATEAVEDAIVRGDSEIVTLGRLIHNDGYCSSLAARGVREISTDDLPAVLERVKAGAPVTVVIRAHGENASVIEMLEACAAENPSLTVLNCTCPFVEKVRKIARENSGEGRRFYLLGAPDHPEVQGIMSCADGGTVFETAEQLSQILDSEASDKSNQVVTEEEITVSVASQTTQKLSEWKKSLEILKKAYTNPKIYDTICIVTEERQKEAADLAGESDVMLIIGSRASSNTAKLYAVCRERCPRSYLIEGASDLAGIDFTGCQTVSITAGASTPYSVIQEVKQTMAEQMENFAELLEESLKTLNTGDVVTGVITSISQNEIHLDLGAKTTGIITHDKLTDDPSAKLSELFKVGDEIKAKVIKVSDIDGIATLDKTRVDNDANWDLIVAAAESGEIMEGRVVEAVKGGVIISLKSVRVFIPASLTGVPKDGELSSIVGTTQRVKVIEIKPERKRAYASIRAVLREERKAQEEAFWSTLEEGQEFDGVIKSLTSYGAFVDLGSGVDGMVHTSELSWKHVRQPSDIVKVGDKLHVFVKSIDRERGRISLGHKTEDTNPWNIFTSKYAVGDVANVKIVSLMPFGAFAEIVDGVDGLIHISQIADHKIAKPDDVLAVGQTVDVKITDIDMDNKKISLSIRALLEPAAEEVAEDAPAVYSTDDPESLKAFEGDEQ